MEMKAELVQTFLFVHWRPGKLVVTIFEVKKGKKQLTRVDVP